MILERPKAPEKRKPIKSRLMHTASRLAIAASLMFILFVPRARTQQQTTTAPEAREVAALKAEFNKTAEGRKLLDFARENDITFVVDSTLADRGNLAEYSPGHSQVRLKPGLEGEELAIYGAHELRHGWQDKKLGYADKETETYLSPQQRWALRRYLEADAAAFSAWFAADRMKHLDLSGADYRSAQKEHEVAKSLRAEFDTADGLTQDEYRTLALEVFLADISGYNPRHLSLAFDYTSDFGKLVIGALTAQEKEGPEAARLLLDPILEKLGKTPDAATFEAYLRQMGGTSFNLEDKTSLQSDSVPVQKLLRDYPFRSGGDDVGEAIGILLTLERLERAHNAFIAASRSLDTVLKNPPPALPVRQEPLRLPLRQLQPVR